MHTKLQNNPINLIVVESFACQILSKQWSNSALIGIPPLPRSQWFTIYSPLYNSFFAMKVSALASLTVPYSTTFLVGKSFLLTLIEKAFVLLTFFHKTCLLIYKSFVPNKHFLKKVFNIGTVLIILYIHS